MIKLPKRQSSVMHCEPCHQHELPLSLPTQTPFPHTPNCHLMRFHVLGKEQAGQTGIHSKAALWLPNSYKQTFKDFPKIKYYHDPINLQQYVQKSEGIHH